MKTCKNCKYFTGVQCHGHGEYYGACKKNKNNLFCYDDTPCLQDVKTLRELYFQQDSKIHELEYKTTSAEIWQERYEIKCRHLRKVENYLWIAMKYIPKEKRIQYHKEILNFDKNQK